MIIGKSHIRVSVLKNVLLYKNLIMCRRGPGTSEYVSLKHKKCQTGTKIEMFMCRIPFVSVLIQ